MGTQLTAYPRLLLNKALKYLPVIVLIMVGMSLIGFYLDGKANERIKQLREERKEIEAEQKVLREEIQSLKEEIVMQEQVIADLASDINVLETSYKQRRKRIEDGKVNEDQFFKDRGY